MAPRPAKPTRCIGANYQGASVTKEIAARGRRSWTIEEKEAQPWFNPGSTLGPADGFHLLCGLDACGVGFFVGQVLALTVGRRFVQAA